MNSTTSIHDLSDKLAYVAAHRDEILSLSTASGLIHEGCIRTDEIGDTLVMLNAGGWMTVNGAIAAGIFDHLIPADLTAKPIKPAAVAEAS